MADAARIFAAAGVDTNHAAIVLPRWTGTTFASGSSTIRQEFRRLAHRYASLPLASPAVNAALVGQAPAEDILGRPRAAADRGAYEWTDLIFADGFQSGGLLEWSLAATDGADAAVSAAAGLGGTSVGLAAAVDDTAGLYVQDDSPRDEGRYRARFHFDTNGFDPGEALGARRTRLFLAFEEDPLRRLLAVVLRRLGGQYSLMGRVRQDDNSQEDTGFVGIADGPHTVEVDWVRATADGAADGTFQMSN